MTSTRREDEVSGLGLPIGRQDRDSRTLWNAPRRECPRGQTQTHEVPPDPGHRPRKTRLSRAHVHERRHALLAFSLCHDTTVVTGPRPRSRVTTVVVWSLFGLSTSSYREGTAADNVYGRRVSCF
mgnify:CR=1 FL=1